MATNVIMPALGMAQETGILLRWFKKEGESVSADEPLMEIETDKVTVEIEAPASGVLANVTAQPGDEIPVGEVIALLLAPGEEAPEIPSKSPSPAQEQPASQAPISRTKTQPATGNGAPGHTNASPLAARIAGEHGIDLSEVTSRGDRIEKSDVLAHMERQTSQPASSIGQNGPRLAAASPKARRLADELGYDVATIAGSGPGGAVLAEDVASHTPTQLAPGPQVAPMLDETLEISRAWQVMVQRLTEAWTAAPHFYLMREANVTRFLDWHESLQAKSDTKITYTDLLVKLVAVALREHPRANASWRDGNIILNGQINVGLAVAVDEGLLVPVIHDADRLSVAQIAKRRSELVTRAQEGSLRPEDMQGGTFTISNLGMFGIDVFSAVVNPPQAAILAVGRIADRVIAIDGEPAVRPMMLLNLSCDHRAIDGARGAQFMQTLVESIEEPLRILE